METHQIERCLTVRQPWAWAICVGAKDIENRTWATRYRGTIAIHAGSNREDIRQIIQERSETHLDEDFFAYWAIIGSVELVDCVEFNTELKANKWAQGPICWKLDNAQLLHTAIPMPGKLRLYRLPHKIADEIAHQLRQTVPMADPVRMQRILSAIEPD